MKRHSCLKDCHFEHEIEWNLSASSLRFAAVTAPVAASKIVAAGAAVGAAGTDAVDAVEIVVAFANLSGAVEIAVPLALCALHGCRSNIAD
jgi:hypothetical protein